MGKFTEGMGLGGRMGVGLWRGGTVEGWDWGRWDCGGGTVEGWDWGGGWDWGRWDCGVGGGVIFYA